MKAEASIKADVIVPRALSSVCYFLPMCPPGFDIGKSYYFDFPCTIPLRCGSKYESGRSVSLNHQASTCLLGRRTNFLPPAQTYQQLPFKVLLKNKKNLITLFNVMTKIIVEAIASIEQPK